ncbi:MAG: proline dehydrogenase family protein, partial [Chloroflexi bacterium]|nr:proline dehydrogenase family protein [Chloroflexota bacterium]
MAIQATSRVESLTQELGSRLYGFVREYHPSRRERRQDWLMGQLSRDPALKTRLLRFMDVLAALDFDTDGTHVKKLFREYFGGPFPRSSPWLRLLLFAGRQRLASCRVVAGAARAALYGIASRFMVGHDAEAVFDALAYLGREGRYATFDLLGEAVLSEHEAEEFKARYLGLIDRLGGHPWSGRSTAAGAPVLQLSIKLSSLTDNFNPADPEGTLRRCRRRLEEIVQHCVGHHIGLNIDAEHFAHRELTWHIFTSIFGPGSVFGRWDGAGITVQSYFRDADVYLRDVLDFARQRRVPFQIRLTKGAYWDYEVITARQNHWPVPVFERKNNTDRAFQRLLGTLLEHPHEVSLAVASHNIRDHAYAEALRSELGLPEGTVEHQTLFRTAEAISRALRRMGWESRDYVPSGGLVPGMAYLVRRILENTSPEGFLWHLRSGVQTTTLLKPPDEVSDYAIPQRTALAGPGFCNTPPGRLFLAREREMFESALQTARDQFGQEYPLELGGQHLRTTERKASLDPSQPDPAHPVGLSHLASVAEAQQAVSIARGGFARWSATAAAERARILAAAADPLVQKRDTLAAWIVHEGGRTWGEALADVDEAADHFAYNAWRLHDCRGLLEAHYQPRGVVAVISPWNFPTALPSGMMSGALAAGNAVILKSAEATPVVAHRLVDILHRAGAPRDVLIHLPGRGPVVGAALVRSADVDMV